MATGMQRKLTTILAADAEGYSRAMDTDEVGTLADLRSARAVFAKLIARHDGRIVNTAGDGLLAEFASVVEAVQCAVEVQRELSEHNAVASRGLRFRIGIHLGDVMVDDGDLFGEGVNLAARLEGMAEPGGILISQQVYDQVRGKLPVGLEYLGHRHPKNFAEDVAVYRVALDGESRPLKGRAPKSEPERAGPPPDADFEDAAIEPKEADRHHEPQQVNLAGRLRRHAQIASAIVAVLVFIDLTTGEPFWAHWPGLALATLLALEAVPLFVRGRLNRLSARGAVVVAALAFVNLFSWAGIPWAIWPAGAFLVAELVRRFWAPAR
jgi:adenylate cyclase